MSRLRKRKAVPSFPDPQNYTCPPFCVTLFFFLQKEQKYQRNNLKNGPRKKVCVCKCRLSAETRGGFCHKKMESKALVLPLPSHSLSPFLIFFCLWIFISVDSCWPGLQSISLVFCILSSRQLISSPLCSISSLASYWIFGLITGSLLLTRWIMLQPGYAKSWCVFWLHWHWSKKKKKVCNLFVFRLPQTGFFFVKEYGICYFLNLFRPCNLKDLTMYQKKQTKQNN